MCHGQASGSSRSRKRQQLFRVFIPEDYVISDTVENMDNGCLLYTSDAADEHRDV